MTRPQDYKRDPYTDEWRCDGRYPVPQTSPPRDEPFGVTYRCALPKGHEGPHGSEDKLRYRPKPKSEPAKQRRKKRRKLEKERAA